MIKEKEIKKDYIKFLEDTNEKDTAATKNKYKNLVLLYIGKFKGLKAYIEAEKEIKKIKI